MNGLYPALNVCSHICLPQIIGSFSQTFCFPRAVAYLDSGKIKTKGMVTDVFKLEDFQQALDKMNSRGALKIAIKP
jgi:D-arabinitol dehydrogenase (NADP+)